MKRTIQPRQAVILITLTSALLAGVLWKMWFSPLHLARTNEKPSVEDQFVK